MILYDKIIINLQLVIIVVKLLLFYTDILSCLQWQIQGGGPRVRTLPPLGLCHSIYFYFIFLKLQRKTEKQYIINKKFSWTPPLLINPGCATGCLYPLFTSDN